MDFENTAMIKTEVEPRQNHSVYHAINYSRFRPSFCGVLRSFHFKEQRLCAVCIFKDLRLK